jgi:hypothetical protein
MFDDLRVAAQADNHPAVGALIERSEILCQRRRRARIDIDDRGG